jgi:hypothetical protein
VGKLDSLKSIHMPTLGVVVAIVVLVLVIHMLTSHK